MAGLGWMLGWVGLRSAAHTDHLNSLRDSRCRRLMGAETTPSQHPSAVSEPYPRVPTGSAAQGTGPAAGRSWLEADLKLCEIRQLVHAQELALLRDFDKREVGEASEVWERVMIRRLAPVFAGDER